jgi:hypothetical protein
MQHHQQKQQVQEQPVHLLNSEVLEKRLVAHISELRNRDQDDLNDNLLKESNDQKPLPLQVTTPQPVSNIKHDEDESVLISSFSIAITNHNDNESERKGQKSSISKQQVHIPLLHETDGTLVKGEEEEEEEEEEEDDDNGSDWSAEWDEDGQLQKKRGRT